MHTTEWDRDLLRETLHEIMERAELNQAAVGRLAGRDRTMANRWLGGQHRPTYESAIRFTQAIAEQYPALSQLGDQFLVAAGYKESIAEREHAPPPLAAPQAADTERALEELRKLAREQDKSIGDILVERGLATPDELTLSDQKRHDGYVQEILNSDLSEEAKDFALMQYAVRRRINFREAGVEEEKTERKPRGA